MQLVCRPVSTGAVACIMAFRCLLSSTVLVLYFGIFTSMQFQAVTLAYPISGPAMLSSHKELLYKSILCPYVM